MVLDRHHRTGLGTFFTGFLHEVHLGTDLQPTETGFQDAVFVKIDFPSVVRFEETKTFFRKNFANSAMGGALVHLHYSAFTAGIVLKLTPRRIERIAYR